ncbi:MAG: hypothetical protein WAU17_10200, partial [Nitrospirales bacterium]
PPWGQPAGVESMGRLLSCASVWLADWQVVGRWDFFQPSRFDVRGWLGSDPSRSLRMTMPGRMWEGSGITDNECLG